MARGLWWGCWRLWSCVEDPGMALGGVVALLLSHVCKARGALLQRQHSSVGFAGIAAQLHLARRRTAPLLGSFFPIHVQLFGEAMLRYHAVVHKLPSVVTRIGWLVSEDDPTSVGEVERAFMRGLYVTSTSTFTSSKKWPPSHQTHIFTYIHTHAHTQLTHTHTDTPPRFRVLRVRRSNSMPQPPSST